jgi:hypothetical protein
MRDAVSGDVFYVSREIVWTFLEFWIRKILQLRELLSWVRNGKNTVVN